MSAYLKRGRKRQVLFLVCAVLVVLSVDAGTGTSRRSSGLRRVRRIDAGAAGAAASAGLAYIESERRFLVAGDGGPGARATTVAFDRRGEPARTRSLGRPMGDPVNIAFDSLSGRLIALDPGNASLSAFKSGGESGDELAFAGTIDATHLGLVDPVGMTADPGGRLYFLDAQPPRLIVADLAGGQGLAFGGERRLPSFLGREFRGLAFDPGSGHLFVLRPGDLELFEISTDAELVAARNLSGILTGRPRGLVFAPSGDATDEPSRTSLYVIESKRSASEGQITEISFSVQAEAPASVPKVTATLVQTIHTYQFSPPSPDPDGIAYLPSRNSYVIVDGEVDEMTIYAGANAFEITPAGGLLRTGTTLGFSNEPTGASYDPVNGHLFISDDNSLAIHDLNPGADGVPFTADDTTTRFSVTAAGSTDPEGVAYDSWRNYLFWVDGLNSEVYRVAPGPNGVFDGASGDDIVTHFDTAVFGVTDPEGLCFDADNGHLFIMGNTAAVIAETDCDGTLLRTIDGSATQARAPAGLGFGPSGVTPGGKGLFLVARGTDNGDDPNENDGEAYEIAFPSLSTGNAPPVVEAGPDQTIRLPQTAILTGTATDDGIPNPPATVTVTWTQMSGPGPAAIASPTTLSTTIGFSAAGTYVFLLTAADGELSTGDTVSVVVQNPLGTIPMEVRVATGADDAEEAASGYVDLYSSDLELVDDGGVQTVGMRFNGLAIPAGATIVSAYVQFKVDETSSTATSLSIRGQAADSAPTFTAAAYNVSSRPRTSAAVAWNPAPWTVIGEAGTIERTPDLTAVVQEIVARPGWASGSSLAVILTGAGERTAEAYNGDPGGAPLLHVEYTTGVVVAHDVAVTAIAAPTPVAPGSAQTVSVTVANQGTVAEAFAVTLTDSLGATVGPAQTVSSLAAGAVQTLIFAWTPTAAGTHVLTATAATVGGETDTADNSATASSIVDALALHDVAVTAVVAPTPVDVGIAQTVIVTVANQGTVTETFTVSLADSLGATVGPPQTVAALAAGADRTLAFAWTPTVTGTHVLTATAAAVSGETDTADNSVGASSIVNVLLVHDVAVTGVVVPTPALLGEAQTASVTVQNQGSVAETFEVGLADSLGSSVGPPQTVGDLAAGASRTLIFAWTPAVAGVHVLTATAAALGGESDAADNFGTATSLVASALVHDIAVLTLAPPAAATRNATQTVNVTAENQGVYTETFQISLADSLGADIGPAQTVTALAPGARQTLSFGWTPTVTGAHDLTATAGTVNGEIDVADNAASAQLNVTEALFALDIRIAVSSDDAEESASGTVNYRDGDLELVDDGGLQTVGLRFASVGLPRDAVISNAYVQFKVDETSTAATALTIRAQASDSPATFTSAAYDISGRPLGAAHTTWSPAAWTPVGLAGVAQRTPNLALLLQEILARPGWTHGNAIALIISGTGRRTAESYNGDKAGAPLLHVEYTSAVMPHDVAVTAVTASEAVMLGQPQTVMVTVENQGTAAETFQVSLADSLGGPVGTAQTVTAMASGAKRTLAFAWTPSVTGTRTLTASVAAVSGETDTSDNALGAATECVPGLYALDVAVKAGSDDAEESLAGVVDYRNGDLELAVDGTAQTVGLRFAGVGLPAGAVIKNAYVQFKVDETSSGTAALVIQGQAADNPATFTSAASGVSSRPRTAALTSWSPAAWPAVGETGAAGRTIDIAPILREITARPGWISGNAIVLIITGTGTRTAESYEGDTAGAPRLHIEYAFGQGGAAAGGMRP